MTAYSCCVCKKSIDSASRHDGSNLDPCALVLVANIDHPKELRREQQFYCHFECFRRLVNDDGVIFIADAAVGRSAGDDEDEDHLDDPAIH